MKSGMKINKNKDTARLNTLIDLVEAENTTEDFHRLVFDGTIKGKSKRAAFRKALDQWIRDEG
jgi:hypothetical protein